MQLTLPWRPTGSTGGGVDPYKNYACLDAYLDTDFFSQLAVLTIGLPITAVVDALKAPA